jgi:glycosyltransferase involved in cell wall biosynthesis
VHPRLADTAIPGPDFREGAVFVGSFAHAPNRDAARWFARQVVPEVRRELPDLPIWMVGADPPEDLVDTAPDGVEYLGWVENLADTYAAARVALAPLRYGAGVKGKVGEAMSYGVPVVATSVGAEGMDLDDGVTALVVDDPVAFAAAIIRLVRDDALWRRVSAAGRDHIEALFGRPAFAAALRNVLEGPRPGGVA